MRVTPCKETKSRREEYAEATRQALLDAAVELFTTRGYHATPIEDIARRARVTRGALYHHFTNKQHLFEAVFEMLEAEMAEKVVATACQEGSAWDRALAGLDAYLDACTDPRIREIMLRQGVGVLGLARARELSERYSMGMLHTMVEDLLASGEIRDWPIDLLSRVLFGGMSEAVLMIGEADDEASARKQAGAILSSMLAGLR